MRQINRHIIHCSDTPIGMDIGVERIREWHVKENGWSDVGYHYIIKLDGTIEHGRPIKTIGAHCRGYNRDSLGTCVVGRNKKDFTEAQWDSLEKIHSEMKDVYPKIKICGHYQLDKKKTCPGFDPIAWWATLQVKKLYDTIDTIKPLSWWEKLLNIFKRKK